MLLLAQEKKIIIMRPLSLNTRWGQAAPPFPQGSGSTTEQFNICLWCKMLDAESHLNAMLREVANQKNKLFKHDAGWKCLII